MLLVLYKTHTEKVPKVSRPTPRITFSHKRVDFVYGDPEESRTGPVPRL